MDLAGLLERVLLVGRGHVAAAARLAAAGAGAAASPGPARRGARGAAEGVEAEGGALGGGAGEGEDLPALVEPDAAGEGRVGRLEEDDADFLCGDVGDDDQEGLEEDDGDEVLSGVGGCQWTALRREPRGVEGEGDAHEWRLKVCQLVRGDRLEDVDRVHVEVLFLRRVKDLPQTVADVCHHGRDEQLVGQTHKDDHDGQAEVRGHLRGDVEADDTGAEEHLEDGDGEGVEGEVAPREQEEGAEEAEVDDEHEAQEADELLAHLLEARQEAAVVGA